MNARRHPLDFDALRKGDIITLEEIERLSGYTYGTIDYALYALQIRGQIKRKLEVRGLVVAIRFDHGHLRILTDAEATIYSSDATHSMLAKALTHHHTLMHVDTRQLADDEKQAHDRRLEVDSKLIQALAQAGLNIRAITHRRTVPGLPSMSLEKGANDVQGTEGSDQGNQSPSAA